MLIVLDSLGMLSTNKEMADTAEGKTTKDMTRAQIVKATFRVSDSETWPSKHSNDHDQPHI